MTDLPPGWEWTPLGEIADVVGGVTKDTKRQDRSGLVEVPYLRVANVQRGWLDLSNVATIRVTPEKSAALRLQHGDILFTEGGDRDKLGRGWVWNGQIVDCIHQNHVFRARLRTDEISPKLVSYYANSVAQRWFESAGRQTTNLASISLTTLKSLPIPIPPHKEQWRILAVLEDHLSRLDAADHLLRSAQQKIQPALRSIFTAAVEGRLVPESPSENVDIQKLRQEWYSKVESKQYRDPAAPNLEFKPRIPRGWMLASLEAVTDPVRVIRYGILKPRVHGNGEVPYIEVRDLSGGLVGKTLRTTSRELDEQFASARVTPGDIVLAVRGSYDRSAVVPPEFDGANISRDVVRLAPLPVINTRYLDIFLQASFAQSYLKRHARGVAVKGVNVSSIREMPIVFPDLALQRKIVAEVERSASFAISAETDSRRLLSLTKSLRRSLLADTFTGLLVLQDPNDEPSSVLLERIRVERVAQRRLSHTRRAMQVDTSQEALL